MSLDDAMWEIRKARENSKDNVALEIELTYARKEIESLRNKVTPTLLGEVRALKRLSIKNCQK